MFVILFVLWISLKHMSMINVVDMQMPASVRYNISSLKLCDKCARNGSKYKIHLIICSKRPALSESFNLDYKYLLKQEIREKGALPCPTYNDIKMFANLSAESELECGTPSYIVLSNELMNDSAPYGVSNFDIQDWDGKIVTVAIVVRMDENNCANATLIVHFDNHAVSTTSFISESSPTSLVLQTVDTDDIYLSKLTVTMIVRCPEDYYQRGCWYYCSSGIQHTCDIGSGVQICTLGWDTKPVSYIDQERLRLGSTITKVFKECSIFNICKFANCSERCIRTGNTSYVCSELGLKYDPPVEILLPGDTVRCYMNNPKNTMTWKYDTTTPDDKRIESNIVMKDDTLFVLPRATPSYNNLVICCATDEMGNQVFNETRNYTIIMYPTMIDVNVTMQHVYLGDAIECYSNAWPPNIFKYNFDVVTNNFKPPIFQRTDNLVWVPKDATLGEMLLNASIEYVDSNGTIAIFYRVFRMYIYAYRQFKWTYNMKPWYQIDDYFTITINIKVTYKLRIIQITGPSVIDDLRDNVVNFNEGCKGGSYKFLANMYLKLNNKYISFHQRLEVTLLGRPTFIRFGYIMGYPNEKLHCLVDGYPDRFVHTFFVIRDSNGEYIKTTKQRILHLPNDAKLNTTYTLNCEYTMAIENSTFYDSVEDIVTLKPRPYPFILVNYHRYLRLLVILMLLAYLFSQLFITMNILCSLRLICLGVHFDHIFKTFLLYNKYRKNVRYDEKMKHITSLIIDLKKHSRYGQKLKLETFFKFLRRKCRDSYTPGFATIAQDDDPLQYNARGSFIIRNDDKVVNEKIVVDTKNKPEVPKSVMPLTTFYGVASGPAKTNTRVFT